MSTYEEFMIILNVGLLIVAILNLNNKKQHPRSGKGYKKTLKRVKKLRKEMKQLSKTVEELAELKGKLF